MTKVETRELKCGCLVYPFDSLEVREHEIIKITEGNKRWQKTICDRTGKWWKVELPDLEEIK